MTTLLVWPCVTASPSPLPRGVDDTERSCALCTLQAGADFGVLMAQSQSFRSGASVTLSSFADGEKTTRAPTCAILGTVASKLVCQYDHSWRPTRPLVLGMGGMRAVGVLLRRESHPVCARAGNQMEL